MLRTRLQKGLDASVLSPKYKVFCRRSVGCFSRRSEPDWRRSAQVIRVEKATQKNSQLAPARRVAMKMGRRLRCSSVTYRFRYAPLPPPVRLGPPCRRPILIATNTCYFGDRTLELVLFPRLWNNRMDRRQFRCDLFRKPSDSRWIAVHQHDNSGGDSANILEEHFPRRM